MGNIEFPRQICKGNPIHKIRWDAAAVFGAIAGQFRQGSSNLYRGQLIAGAANHLQLCLISQVQRFQLIEGAIDRFQHRILCQIQLRNSHRSAVENPKIWRLRQIQCIQMILIAAIQLSKPGKTSQVQFLQLVVHTREHGKIRECRRFQLCQPIIAAAQHRECRKCFQRHSSDAVITAIQRMQPGEARNCQLLQLIAGTIQALQCCQIRDSCQIPDIPIGHIQFRYLLYLLL